ncbi:MAG: DUF2752 domain-containing protein [Mycobacteriaceae bacterium]|jgi:Protein of unknown function (DUF2752)|nr:DUF2752 domain-containing protein [Mycobacteriaceae bacterium]
MVDRLDRARVRLYGGLGVGALGAGALAYVGLVDPHRPDSLYPPCPFRMLTGWYCPACGGLRMTHDLLHGHVAAAATDNIVALIGLPLLLIWAMSRIGSGRKVITPAVLIVIAVIAVVWTVLRNLPGFPLVPTVFG